MVRRIKEILSQYSISQRLFGEAVLGLSQVDLPYFLDNRLCGEAFPDKTAYTMDLIDLPYFLGNRLCGEAFPDKTVYTMYSIYLPYFFGQLKL